MEQNGVDIATLGLRVDARPVEAATAALDRFRETGEKAEAQSKSFGITADEVARLNARTYERIAQAEEQWQAEKAQREAAAAERSAATAEQAARAQIAALERAFQEEQAEVRLAVASGFLKPAEAEKLGRETAARFNKGLADAITDARSAGAFKGSAGRQALVDVTQSIKDVGSEGRKAGLGLGRLNDAFVTVARQATGTSPVVGKLVDTIGTFAIGTAYMVPVLAGLAAIGYGYQALTKDAREAEKAQDDALESLDRLRQAQADEDRGPAGARQREVETARDREAELLARLDDLRDQLSRAQRSGGSGRETRIEGVVDRLRAAYRELEDVQSRIAAGERDVTEAVSDEANQRAEVIQALAVEVTERTRALEAARAGGEATAALTTELAREAEIRRVLATTSEEEQELAIRLVNAKYDAIAATEAQNRANAEAEKQARAAAAAAERDAEAQRRRTEASNALAASLAVEIDAQARILAATPLGAQAVEEVNAALAREAALRQALTTATDEQAAAITAQVNRLQDLREATVAANRAQEDLKERTSREYEESLSGIQRYEEGITSATEAQARFANQTISGLQNVGKAFGDLGEAIAGLGGNLLGVKLEFDRTMNEIQALLSAGLISPTEARRQGEDAAKAFQSGLAAAAIGGATGFIAGAVSGILSKREDRAREVEAARAEFERVLDAYVDELADASRWERLQADVAGGAQDAFGALLDSLFADLATRGSFGKEAAARLKEQLQGAVDVQGLEEVLSKFGPEGQAILDEYRKKLERIEEQRRKEIQAQEDEIAVRTLIAQGKDDEAAALRRQLDEQAQLKAALELGGKALADLWAELFRLEEASRAAAKAAEEAAEAQRRADTRRDFEADLGIIQAQNAGDEVAAFSIGAEVQAAQDIANARKLFEDGIIDQQLLDAFIEAVGVRLKNAIEETTQAIEEAARAEEYRAGVELQNLQLRLLYANGLTDEALLLKQSLELQDAIFQGKSDEYIATLKQVQAAERAAAQARKQTQALQEQARAAEEATRALDGTSRALTRITTEDLARYRNQVLRNASAFRDSDPFGVEFGTPRFGGAAGGTLRIEAGAIIVNAAPGQDPQQIARAVIDEVDRKRRAGGVNPLGGIL